MELSNIIQGLYLDQRVKEFINKQQPCHLRGDLLHHCITEIYRINDKYPGKIEALYNKGELFAWFVGMVRNQLHSNKSTFFTKFRRVYLSEECIPHNPDWPDYEIIQKPVNQAFVNQVYNNIESGVLLADTKAVQMSLF